MEKKTFLEYVPQVSPLRRSSSLPLFNSASEPFGEKPKVNSLVVPKVFRMLVSEHGVQCTEPDSASPGAASMLGSCAAWQLASTRGGSNASLMTSFVGDSTHGGSAWHLEAEDTEKAEAVPEVDTDPAAGSPKSARSRTSSTTTGSVQPSESVGAALHGTGHCRPCAWYWRPGSCTRGAECLHCHLCADGELAKRRFQNRKLAKMLKKEKRGASSTNTSSESL